MTKLTTTDEYRDWIVSIKQRVKSSQIKAAIAVNSELIELYWFIGGQIVERQANANWGDGFLKQMSRDLLDEFPKMRGFSVRNLQVVRRWYQFWSVESAMAQQLVAQLPWGHNMLMLQKLDAPADALFYVRKTIENNWSRAVLTHQIESGLKRCIAGQCSEIHHGVTENTEFSNAA